MVPEVERLGTMMFLMVQDKAISFVTLDSTLIAFCLFAERGYK